MHYAGGTATEAACTHTPTHTHRSTNTQALSLPRVLLDVSVRMHHLLNLKYLFVFVCNHLFEANTSVLSLHHIAARRQLSPKHKAFISEAFPAQKECL